MTKENKKSHSRAIGMTQISISLPQDLVDKIDSLAKEDKRSRSNYIAYIIQNLPESNADVSFTKGSETTLCAVK